MQYSEKELREDWEKLVRYFEVRAPILTVSSRRKVSCYRPLFQEIIIALKGRGMEHMKYALTHEFAHHLDYIRCPVREGRKNHDRAYMKVLIEVIDVLYDDRADYPWSWEYASIRHCYPHYVIAYKQKTQPSAAGALQIFLAAQHVHQVAGQAEAP